MEWGWANGGQRKHLRGDGFSVKTRFCILEKGWKSILGKGAA